MIIGEAPGEQEDRTGKPFQGRSGKLLNDMLEAAGIDRSECYVTNIVKCRPPENRTPSAAEVKTCKPYLDAEIAAVKPEFILTLGATALKGITKKAKITELHGQQFDYAGTTVVPTFHPAAALRDPARLDPLRKDIVKFGHILNGNVPSADELHWEVIRTMDQWNQFIEEFSETKEVAIDIETTGLDRYADGAGINSIQFGLDTGRNWSLPLEVRDSPWKDKQKVRQRFVETLVELAEGDELIRRPLHPYTKTLLSAIPVPEPGAKKARIVLEGDVPSPANPPTGCRFHTRCPERLARCSQEEPAFRPVADRMVACHLLD